MVQGSDYGYFVGYGVMLLKIKVTVSVGGVSVYIGGEGPVRVPDNEYILDSKKVCWASHSLSAVNWIVVSMVSSHITP